MNPCAGILSRISCMNLFEIYSRIHRGREMKKFKLLKIACSGIKLVRNPDRLEEVFNLADYLEDDERRDAMVEAFSKDPELATVIKERPRVGQIDLQKL